MTEAEWLAQTDPEPMLVFLARLVGGEWPEPEEPPVSMPASLEGVGQGRSLPCLCCRTRCDLESGLCPAYRKLRLFSCACCRRISACPCACICCAIAPLAWMFACTAGSFMAATISCCS